MRDAPPCEVCTDPQQEGPVSEVRVIYWVYMDPEVTPLVGSVSNKHFFVFNLKTENKKPLKTLATQKKQCKNKVTQTSLCLQCVLPFKSDKSQRFRVHFREKQL